MLKNILTFFLLSLTYTANCQIGWENNIIIDDSVLSPTKCAVEDLNNDGFLDIIVLGSGICWFKNLNGQGSFGIPTNIVNESVTDFNIVDIDGDGFKDIIYLKNIINNNQITWKKNINGNGSFGSPVILNEPGYYSKMQISDIENDGDLDITYLSNAVIYNLKNNGSGIFTDQIMSSSTSTDFLRVDINGDNLQDIIIRDLDYKLDYYQQNITGTYTFKETMDSFVVNGSNNSFIVSGDIDADGDIDIAVMHENGSDKRIKWYKNNNNVFANFLTLMLMPNDDTGLSLVDTRNILLKDFDNDGLVDVVMQHSFLNRISWYKNLGVALGFGSQQIISNSIINNRSIAMGDINNNAKQDIICVGRTNSDVVWFDNTTGLGNTFIKNQIGQSINKPSKISIGDIDGDGKKDVLVTSTSDDKLSWYRNTNGLGDFSESQKIITDTLIDAQNGLLVDMNNDGKNDIIALSLTFVTTPAPKLVQFLNLGNGQFSPEQLIYSVANDNINKIEAIDVDNDGDLDIVASSVLGDMKVFKNNGNATFATPILFAQSGGFFVPTDVDNDGDVDLVVASTSALFWLENTDGQGDFSNKVVIPTNLALPKKFVIKDIDNDGLKDVVYINSNLGRITINANGTFGTQSILINLGNSNVMDIADLDNDGDLDIVCSASSGFGHIFCYFLNLGDGNFGPATLINFENMNDIPYFDGYTSLAIDDINGDGKKDIFLSVSDFIKVMWFENKGLFSNEINGKVSLDVANNGCTSASNTAQQILVSTSEANYSHSTFSDVEGKYSFNVGEGNYTTNISSPISNYPSNPPSYTNNLVGINNTVTSDFCLQPTQLFDDLVVSFYPINNARPGFEAEYVLVIKNKGTNIISSSVTLNYNSTKLQFINAEKPILNQTPNTIQFAFTDLLPFEQFKTKITFNVNNIPIVNLGEQVLFTASNTLSTDSTPDNNSFSYNQTIVGSYDPNDIQVLEGEEVLISDSDKYLHYIVRFQNTGNFYAERVKINVPIDDKLDWNTMELEAYSHNQRTEISNGNLITFTFDAIYLPGQQTNEENSKGFIAFKIKPKNTISLGDIVQENASVYFDYNPPIITNQVDTVFVSFLSDAKFETEKIVVYPNPVNEKLYLSINNEPYNASLYNVLGQLVVRAKDESYIDFSTLTTGIYFLKISIKERSSQTIRIIKK